MIINKITSIRLALLGLGTSTFCYLLSNPVHNLSGTFGPALLGGSLVAMVVGASVHMLYGEEEQLTKKEGQN